MLFRSLESLCIYTFFQNPSSSSADTGWREEEKWRRNWTHCWPRRVGEVGTIADQLLRQAAATESNLARVMDEQRRQADLLKRVLDRLPHTGSSIGSSSKSELPDSHRCRPRRQELEGLPSGGEEEQLSPTQRDPALKRRRLWDFDFEDNDYL